MKKRREFLCLSYYHLTHQYRCHGPSLTRLGSIVFLRKEDFLPELSISSCTLPAALIQTVMAETSSKCAILNDLDIVIDQTVDEPD
jgi:hypothetical protein